MLSDELSAISDLLDTALDLDETERGPWLAELHRTRPDIAPKVEALLARTEDLKTDDLLVREGRSIGPKAIAEAMETGGSDVQGFLLQPGAAVGPYRLIRPLGEGGMASVWLAERSDKQLKRTVALKLLHAWRNSKELVERFARERDMLASLAHPHIARLYDAGVTPLGQPWIALEYVEGIDLASYADKNRLSIRARVEEMLQVMSAVQYAHQNLIVHRDIKPNNILVNNKGEVRLLDFGIAKLLHADGAGVEETELTINAGRALTLRYAAPEQLKGEAITTATDVFALGLVLYELLLGSNPRTGTKTQILSNQAVHETELHRPSRGAISEELSHRRGNITAKELKTQLSGDLDTILLKALAREPSRRYRTVDAFASDLRAWLEYRPITARSPSLAYQLRMFLVRQRVPVAAAGVVLAVLTGAAGYAWQQRAQAAGSEARSRQAQQFMANLLIEAESDDGRSDQAVSLNSLLNAGVARARRDYAGDPRLLAQLLGELARSFSRIGDDKNSQALYTETVSLLERNGAVDEPSLHKARAFLGQIHNNRREFDAAKRLFDSVLTGCTRAGPACDEARGLAHLFVSWNPDLPRQEMRRNLENAFALLPKGVGMEAESVTQARTLLASLERTEGNFAAARAHLAAVEAQFVLRRPKSPERVLFGQVRTQLAFDEGAYTQAAAAADNLLAELSATKLDGRRVYSHTMRAHIANYEGFSNKAIEHVAAVKRLSADKPSIDLAYARRYEARAHMMARDFASAESSVNAAFALINALNVQEGDEAWLDMMRARAELNARTGELQRARRGFEQGVSTLRDRYPANFRDVANNLSMLGAVILAMGDTDAAIKVHADEIALLDKHLPLTHPMRLRAELCAARARHAKSGDAAELKRLQELITELKKPLPEGSVHVRALSELEESVRRNERTTKLLLLF
jgi:eukaryotic-like serine/threonine-protein kinase